MTGSYFKTRFSEGASANVANHANPDHEISIFSIFSRESLTISDFFNFAEKLMERAAIMEFDAGMTRQEAEEAAFKEYIDKRN